MTMKEALQKAGESLTLVEHLKSCKRHEVQDTLSLNNARNMPSYKQNVAKRIRKVESFNIARQELIKEKRAHVKNLRKERDTINRINIQFAKFLRQSVIAPFNDVYADYLDHFIQEEKIKKAHNLSNYNDKVLKGLERVYLTKIESIKNAIGKDHSFEQLISPEDIEMLVQELYSLELYGAALKKANDIEISSENFAFLDKSNNGPMREKVGTMQSQKHYSSSSLF
ncbi:2362_t:CDS:2 [Paraglomus occultum]|uniref:2362_t:CDS:1 n=1 Tax=Paraglomus occultum TaxID=144539 RepID=A0A9N9CZH0_9GLOM|nr:2362_t:CDS:2 [Paraglomus occultum]